MSLAKYGGGTLHRPPLGPTGRRQLAKALALYDLALPAKERAARRVSPSRSRGIRRFAGARGVVQKGQEQGRVRTQLQAGIDRLQGVVVSRVWICRGMESPNRIAPCTFCSQFPPPGTSEAGFSPVQIGERLFVSQKQSEDRPIRQAGQPNATRPNVTPRGANPDDGQGVGQIQILVRQLEVRTNAISVGVLFKSHQRWEMNNPLDLRTSDSDRPFGAAHSIEANSGTLPET